MMAEDNSTVSDTFSFCELKIKQQTLSLFFLMVWSTSWMRHYLSFCCLPSQYYNSIWYFYIYNQFFKTCSKNTITYCCFGKYTYVALLICLSSPEWYLDNISHLSFFFYSWVHAVFLWVSDKLTHMFFIRATFNKKETI
jgi:hypothetical protein